MFSFSRTLCYALFALAVGVKAVEVDVNIGEGGVGVYGSTRPKSKIAISWYAGWHATEGFPLSKVSWNKYTHLTYSFACVYLFELSEVM